MLKRLTPRMLSEWKPSCKIQLMTCIKGVAKSWVRGSYALVTPPRMLIVTIDILRHNTTL
jgi:hypothetical protein